MIGLLLVIHAVPLEEAFLHRTSCTSVWDKGEAMAGADGADHLDPPFFVAFTTLIS